MIIAMVGCRELSKSQWMYCESVGAFYAEKGVERGGVTICSGNAPGADQAFVMGAMLIHYECVRFQLYLPWPTFEHRAVIGFEETFHADMASDEQRNYAEWAHPAWHRCRDAVRLLFVRNAQIVWNAHLVVAHPDVTKRGWGGTGHAIRVARMRGVPVYLCNRELQRFFVDGEC